MRLIKASLLLENGRHVNVFYWFIFFLLYAQITYGQDSVKNKNSLTVEVAGYSRSLFSINYERLNKLSPNYFLYTIRAGIGYTPGANIKSERHKGTVTTPLVLSLLAGKKKHFAQLSIGYTASFGQDFIDSTTTTPTIYQKFESAYILSLGYRYMRNGFVGQAFPLLQWTNNPSSKFSVGFGVSLGLTF